MPQYRGNVGNLLQHWVLCELVAESGRHFKQIRFVDAFAMAPLATERVRPGPSASLFDHVRDRTHGGTPYERTWHQLAPNRSAYPNSASFFTTMWATSQRQSPECDDIEIAGADWRERFERSVATSDTLTYLSFDPDKFDRHGSDNPRIMDPADLDAVAAALEPIRGAVLVQLSTYSANRDNGQEAVAKAVVSGLNEAGLTLLARVRVDGQMMSLVLGRHAGSLGEIGSLPARFDSWLSIRP